MDNFSIYFQALQSCNLSEITEYSLRPELKSLLSSIAENIDSKINILHEGKREGGFGAPDFSVRRIGNIIGYVENKKIGENLDNVIKSDQIRKYQQLSDNILITDYLEWIWLNKGDIQRKTLCYLSDIENKKAKLDPQNAVAVENLVKGFLSSAPEGIAKPKDLASALAIRGKLLKDFLAEELQRQENQDSKGKLFGLYQTFQSYVFNELTLDAFADAFSQNLIYGVFLAKLNADMQTVTLSNAEEFIPTNFELIRELVEFLKVLNRKEYADIRWVIEEVLNILNTMNFREIKSALSFTRTFGEQEDPYSAKDPYIYFYEDFLAAYDKKLRKSKGVYYTPPQIVNFIVRSVSTLLRETFHLPDGLADHEKVTILDFATGTGTFLLEVIRQIFKENPHSEKDLLIREHILKNLYGFEYLIAPYTIAHLKLYQFLKDHGYKLNEDERLQIFLTNTLEPTDRQISIPLLPALTEETKQAQIIKDKPILVIMGNPPYSYGSQNTGKWISEKIKGYYVVNGEKLDEKNPKGLQDDYVKFIRFAQDKMDQVKEGIVAIITNHSFLDNPTFRGMRQSLMNTFDLMYFVDLHGNVKKKEKTPQGDKDENVFDIEQGVAISIMVKKPGLEKKVYHADFWGLRTHKYEICLSKNLETIKWKPVKIAEPYYLFKYQPDINSDIYLRFKPINEIFKAFASGVKTHHDEHLIGFDTNDLTHRVKSHFQITPDSSFYYKNYHYRPFDKRILYYDSNLVKRARLNQHAYFKGENYGLIILRQAAAVGSASFDSAFIVNGLADTNLYRRGGPFIFPLFTYDTKSELLADKNNERITIKIENFAKDFRNFIDELYQKKYTPEEILGYIYAILHSTSYRNKYADFLKTDFPRIPFVKDFRIFERLSELGWQLIQAHLMNEIPDYEMGIYAGEGNNEVIKPDYRKTEDYQRLYINKTQYFDRVPENVYQFYIGGYQVLCKYLKDRQGRQLNLSEVRNIRNIIRVLAFTIEQMKKIDEAVRDWV